MLRRTRRIFLLILEVHNTEINLNTMSNDRQTQLIISNIQSAFMSNDIHLGVFLLSRMCANEKCLKKVEEVSRKFITSLNINLDLTTKFRLFDIFNGLNHCIKILQNQVGNCNIIMGTTSVPISVPICFRFFNFVTLTIDLTRSYTRKNIRALLGCYSEEIIFNMRYSNHSFNGLDSEHLPNNPSFVLHAYYTEHLWDFSMVKSSVYKNIKLLTYQEQFSNENVVNVKRVLGSVYKNNIFFKKRLNLHKKRAPMKINDYWQILNQINQSKVSSIF